MIGILTNTKIRDFVVRHSLACCERQFDVHVSKLTAAFGLSCKWPYLVGMTPGGGGRLV